MCKKIIYLSKNFMPLIVSVAALIVAYNSYSIAQSQLNVATIGVEPHFYVDEVPIYDEATKSWHERELKIFNVGAPAANISTNVSTFYKVNGYGEIGERLIPLSGYYYAVFRTGEPKGKLSTHIGRKNAEKDFNATFTHFRDKNSEYVDIQLMHAVFVSYRAFNGDKKEVCFLGQRLVECKSMNKYRQSPTDSRLELDGLTYQKLIAKYEEYKI